MDLARRLPARLYDGLEDRPNLRLARPVVVPPLDAILPIVRDEGKLP